MAGAGSRAWTAVTIAGLVVWIGSVVAVAATRSSAQDDGAVTTAFVIGGAVFFSLVFGAAAVQMRRLQRRARHDLFHRLALVPIAPDELRRATAPMYTIGYVYVAFGAVVTALGLVAVAAGAGAERRVLGVMAGVVMLWLVYAAYALARGVGTAASVVRPLGLELTEIPQHHVSTFVDRTWMTGAMTYAGQRHGRAVSISQTPKAAVTIVAGADAGAEAPRHALEMAQLTGESPLQWRGVEVRCEQGAVIVTRRRNGAGAWFLHDLLLAETVAGAA